MAELTYRDAVIRGIAQEMERDPDVVFLGEDVGKAGGVFKATVGLYEQFGPLRVRDTPISEQAILGAAMGAATTHQVPGWAACADTRRGKRQRPGSAGRGGQPHQAAGPGSAAAGADAGALSRLRWRRRC